MSEKISIDFETRSIIDIRKVDAYKYAEHPSTKVLILAIRKWGTDEVLTWDIREEPNEAIELLRQAIELGWEIHAFNYTFEWAILKYVCPRQLGLPVPDIEQMRCTQAVCRSAGLPPSLGACAEFLKLPIQKDKMGAALIQKFSVPQKKTNRFIEWSDDVSFTVGGMKLTAGEAFQKFVDYCVTDVNTEMAISETMKAFELKGFPLEWFQLDARLNDRGLPVDGVALRHAFEIMTSHEKNLLLRFKEITGFGPKQNKVVLKWLQERGYRGTNLTAATREKYGGDTRMSSEAKEAMGIAADLSFAAVKKVPAMLVRMMSDGRIRGVFKWCGAQKTWRWTSNGVQVQNMKKPPKWLRKVIEEAYQDVRDGRELMLLEMLYGNPYELVACLARYFIRFDDKNLFDLDFASVEARVLPALIECKRVLDRFVSGEGDIYTQTAESLSKILKEKFEVDFEIDRDMGKVVVLATQFQGGWNAVFTATGSKWKRPWCEAAAKIVRDENPEFPFAWRKFQDSFVAAMDTPEKWQTITKYVSIGYTKRGAFPRMLMKLASGRSICWPHPARDPITMVKIETLGPKQEVLSKRWDRVSGHFTKDELDIDGLFLHPKEVVASTFKTWEISFYGHVKGKLYGRVKTYGGDMLQSCLVRGTPVLTEEGFKPIEAITPADRVWDGVEFVRNDGAVNQGNRPCVSKAGLSGTHDHTFMVDNCWVRLFNLTHDQIASQSKEFARESLREFASDRVNASRASDELEAAMRLRGGSSPSSLGAGQVLVSAEQGSLQPGMPLQRIERPEIPRTEQPPDIRSSRLHDVPVLSGGQRELPSLRGQGDQGVQTLAQPGELFQGHAPDVGEGVGHRQDQGPRELHAKKCSLAHSGAELSEQGRDLVHGDSVGPDDCEGGVNEVRDWIQHPPLPDQSQSPAEGDVQEAEFIQEVFDILNCGPRRRFAVLTDHGLILAHNCTQGTAADLLAYGAIEAERKGFEPLLLVHDQCLATGVGDKEEFRQAMTTVPPWFAGFPLDADADVVRSYCKN